MFPLGLQPPQHTLTEKEGSDRMKGAKGVTVPIICLLQFIRFIIFTHPTCWEEILLHDGGMLAFNPILVSRQAGSPELSACHLTALASQRAGLS